jgi:hypothetical protein
MDYWIVFGLVVGFPSVAFVIWLLVQIVRLVNEKVLDPDQTAPIIAPDLDLSRIADRPERTPRIRHPGTGLHRSDQINRMDRLTLKQGCP